MAHTPGPWRIKGPSEPIEYDLGGDYAIIAASTLIIGEVYSQIGTHFRIDAIDNARLIAAAPELLEVARRMSSLEDDDGGRKFPTKEDIIAARAAIAKAEGASDA